MIIGLGYKARSGKDTVASYLCCDHGFTSVAFAGNLKEAARVIFGLSQDQLYGHLKDVLDPYWNDTPRNILQRLGTECLRNGYRKDVWVMSLGRKILAEPNRNWVVSDVRFFNEAESIRQWGGYLVQVSRANAPVIETAQHQSEIEMDKYDGWHYHLKNDGSLEDLDKSVETMIGTMKELYAIQQKAKVR
jgi:hypothetical protein